nr:calcium-dependent protein kinase SK5-like [Tanacetum cinerariifolium]
MLLLEKTILLGLWGSSKAIMLASLALKMEWQAKGKSFGILQPIYVMFRKNYSFNELKEGLRRVGPELMEFEIKDLINVENIDNNGTINVEQTLYSEFYRVAIGFSC